MTAVLCGFLERVMTQIDDEKMRDITSVLIEGLNTDGAHHKQYAMEQALKLLVPDEFDDCKASWQWMPGIAA